MNLSCDTTGGTFGKTVYWMSKKQNSCESSSFGSLFFAMKQFCEYLCGMWYKLYMLGYTANGTAYIIGYKKYFFCKTIFLDSMLKKKG